MITDRDEAPDDERQPAAPTALCEFEFADDDSAANAVHLKCGTGPRIFVIEGPPGVGKTALAWVAAERLQTCPPPSDRSDLLASVERAYRSDYPGITFDNVSLDTSLYWAWPVLIAASRSLRIVITGVDIWIPCPFEGNVARIRLVKPPPRVSE